MKIWPALVMTLLSAPAIAAVGDCKMPVDLEGLDADFYRKMYCIHAGSAVELKKLHKKSGEKEAGDIAESCVKSAQANNNIYVKKSGAKPLDYVSDCVGNQAN